MALPGAPIELTDFYDDPVVYGLGSLWVRSASRLVLRLNPKTGAVIGHYPADPLANGGWPAAAYGSLWMANFDTDAVWRVRVTS